MSSQIAHWLPEKMNKLTYCSNESQGVIQDQLVLRQFDFMDSARKSRCELLTVPMDDAFLSGSQSSRKQTDQSCLNTTYKDTTPSRFTASGTKIRSLGQPNDLKSELIREYEMALDQIQSALADKNFELLKTIREMEIRLQEKERYVQEITVRYQQHIEIIESSYIKATQKLMELQNTCKDQAIKIEEYELKLDSQTDTLKKLKMKQENSQTQYEENLLILKQSIKDLSKLLESQKQRTKKLSGILNSSNIDTQQIISNKFLNLELRSEVQIFRKSFTSKESQCQKLLELCEKLQVQQKEAERKLAELSHNEVLHRQSEKVLAETHLIGNLILKELNQTKEKLIRLTAQHKNNKCLIEQQSQQLASLRFENQTLVQYNKVLVQKLNTSQSERPKQIRRINNFSGTFCYSGSI